MFSKGLENIHFFCRNQKDRIEENMKIAYNILDIVIVDKYRFWKGLSFHGTDF